MHCQGRSSNLSMFVFFFNDTATTEIYTLSLHDALPIFDFTNGFHDTANAIATSVSTRAMSPRSAVALAALLNFAGAFISLEVAATIANGIVESGAITEQIVFAGLIGAIAWNLVTWYFGLPSSSSHALIGGVAGAAFVAAGPDSVLWDGLIEKVAIPAVVAPFIAFASAGL